MPDLSLQAAHQFWKDYQDPMIYRVISFMEGVENWTLDNQPELESAMDELGKQLDDIGKIDLNTLGHEVDFIRISNFLRTSRVLRLLQTIDSVHPGSASKVLMYAEEHSEGTLDPTGLFLRRNIVFERLRLLARVFAVQRVKLVLKALEGEEHE
ncbi:MAG: icmW [Gammaproteobacteria bacterium]|jgi:intracellular multiplication protein IcmW|nr:icmW [Gammaproteobacteria bacterium]